MTKTRMLDEKEYMVGMAKLKIEMEIALQAVMENLATDDKDYSSLRKYFSDQLGVLQKSLDKLIKRGEDCENFLYSDQEDPIKKALYSEANVVKLALYSKCTGGREELVRVPIIDREVEAFNSIIEQIAEAQSNLEKAEAVCNQPMINKENEINRYRERQAEAVIAFISDELAKYLNHVKAEFTKAVDNQFSNVNADIEFKRIQNGEADRVLGYFENNVKKENVDEIAKLVKKADLLIKLQQEILGLGYKDDKKPVATKRLFDFDQMLDGANRTGKNRDFLKASSRFLSFMSVEAGVMSQIENVLKSNKEILEFEQRKHPKVATAAATTAVVKPK